MAITASVPNDEACDARRFESLERTVRENQASIADTVKLIVSDLGRTIEEKLAAGYYTREQADAALAARVASPGAIAPTTVTASGAVTSATTVSATGAGSFGGTLAAGGRLTANTGMTSTGVRANQVSLDGHPASVARAADSDGAGSYVAAPSLGGPDTRGSLSIRCEYIDRPASQKGRSKRMLAPSKSSKAPAGRLST